MPSPPVRPRSYLLVDGHNILHAWPQFRGRLAGKSSRHLAQLDLLRTLRNFQDMTETQVVVVFDGTRSTLQEEREDGGLQIFYATATSTADAIIERLAAKYASTCLLRVASADGLIRDAVMASGADWLSPEMLLSLCQQAEEQMRQRIK